MSDRLQGGGLKRLNDSVLVRGDIVLTTTTATVSKIIRATTRSDISHAMIYIEDRSVIDATSEGVQARNTQRLFFEEECAVHVMRLRTGISESQLKAVESYARGYIGTQYSAKEAVLTAFGGGREWSTKQFCSRLVAQAYYSAGIQLVSDPNFCSPAELQRSPALESVHGATVAVTAEEKAAWEDREDVTQLMRDAINAVLSGARKKDASIQTFDDIHRYLVDHPQYDRELCELLDASGYLSIWRIELQKNQWQYDLGLMNAAPANEIEKYCWSVLKNEVNGPNRYVINRGGYQQFYRQFGFHFFRIMLELYEQLAALHRQRVEIATEWLATHGHIGRPKLRHLIPHTPEWFAALEQWDPPKAMMTRLVIDRTGQSVVCSICGDDPAKDYCLPAEYRAAGGVDTLRLCDDCLKIRRDQGEPFTPLL